MKVTVFRELQKVQTHSPSLLVKSSEYSSWDFGLRDTLMIILLLEDTEVLLGNVK